ncbi:MAG: hypothetical protein IPL71_18675 [Anaerolineales bacterium]|uniref:hypothetical protein n=1 Tax=Candidatus Villigracilis proximus TaxID=3140683 RepID=UPI003137101B|nr:hypothetical protein [Anaerolineales bacterium]
MWLGWSGAVTPSKPGYGFTPAKRIYSNLAADQTDQNYTVSFSTFKDSSFEFHSSSPFWSEYSVNFGVPWCIATNCGNGGGTAGPRSYNGWIWFGGTPNIETGYVSQIITLPNGFPNLKLQFYLWIGYAAPGSDAADAFLAKVDGVTVFSANATQQYLYPTYTPVLVDISSFANNGPHTITFSTVTAGQVVTFNLDDVNW